ncbi:putative transposase [Malonomonas rubra DSM 5091]|uniref:Putative transposase n=1 Tax=Malonomonas rubra DSM 5091 TaxID=1122189 RepID=A0A1M6H7U7_MALRU|nr:Mu transposase C-terminal domain-containing protein [Malonomonas rubra]SHJ18301.1 putative transposase [Malonomonas rubra DSM 5091]
MAVKISLKPGDKVFCEGVEYEISGPAGLTKIDAINLNTGGKCTLDIGSVSGQTAENNCDSFDSLENLTDEEQNLALQRFQIIKPALLRDLTRAEIEELAEEHGVHFTTVYRLMREFRKTRSPASLVPKTGLRGGRGKARIDESVDLLIQNHFEDIYREKLVDITKLNVKTLQKEIQRKCVSRSLKAPSWGTVNDRLGKFIDDKKLEKKRKRKGGRPRTMAGRVFPDADSPLAVVQIDHTPLDLIVVDDEHREPIGRPILSLAIDVYSRMVVGFSLSLDHPGIFSVGRLIAHCILPKEQFLAEMGVDAAWDIYGVMGMIHMDNAGEFRTEDFIPFQEEYLVDVRWRPVASPEYGGHIERLAKTLNDHIHQEPGATMSNIFERSGYDSEGKACYTLSEIEKWLTVLITKIYHHEKHSSLKNSRGEKLSPLEKYSIGILGDGKTPGTGLPDIVENQERLKIFLLPSFQRTVQREGIELDDIHYFHDILRNLYGKKDEKGRGKKYLIKRDPRCITPIYIYDPTLKKYFAVPYRDQTRPPMNLWELKAAKKRCKEKGLKRTEPEIFKAYDELRQMREESVVKTKKAKRERQAEKRRKKAPTLPQQKVEAPAPPEELETTITDEIENFYDDPALLEGVTVKGNEDKGATSD